MGPKILSKGKKILDDIHEMKTIGELLDYIPRKLIQRIALLILFIWTASPLFAMAYASSARLYGDPDWISLYNQMNMMTVKWYKLLMQLGLSGCIIGILSLLKNIRESRQDNNTKQFFKDRIIAKFLLMMLFGA